MNILTVAPALMSGAALLAGFYHILIYSRLKHQRFNLTFALLCFSIGVYDFFTTGLYLSSSVAEGMWWSRAQITTLQLCGISLLWFIVDYTQHKPRKMLYGFTIYLALSALLSVLNPFNILQEPTLPSIKYFDFGLVEITYYEVESGVLSSIQGLSTILLFGYMIVVILKYYKRGYHNEAKPLILVFTLFFIGIFNDSAIVVHLYDNIYIIEYTYIFMVIFMTYIISKKVVDAAVLEQALHENEARYRHIVEGMSDGLSIVDETGKISFVNDHLCRMLGYEHNQLLGHFLSELLTEDNIKILDNQRNEHRKGKQGAFELTWKGVNGRKIYTLVSAAFLFEKNYRFTGSIAVITDITERKRAEETIKKLYEETMKISEMKSNLITFVSHELKTPIVPILGWSQLMQKALNEGLDLNKIIEREGVEGIIRSSNRLSNIINNFLDLDRLERGNLSLEKLQWPVITLLNNAIKQITGSFQEKMITIKNSCENIELNVDGFRVEQVFINILSNALKYSPPNSSIEIYSEKDETEFIIYFRDQGYGFTPEELGDIWQPFTTAYLRKKPSQSTGTGIGLRISKGIMEEHQGRIEISSPGADRGSTVKLKFPLKTEK